MPGWRYLLPPKDLNVSLSKITKAKVEHAGGDFRNILSAVKDNSLGLVLPIIVAIGAKCGFKYFALCTAVRRRVGMGKNVRKRCYYVIGLSKGKVQARGYLEEYLGEYTFIGSTKPWEANLLLLRHSLPPGEKWLDPFPATHTELPGEIRKYQSAQLSALYGTKKMRKSDSREVL